MEQNKEFLEKTLKLFYLNGAKTTTMDDIAKEFSMSKKTLYQMYPNKDVLLDEVLNYEAQQVILELKLLNDKDVSPIEKMLCREKKIKDMTENNHSFFVRQLKKYYPHLYERHTKRISDEVSKVLIYNIERGREQGVFRQDFNEKDYARFLMLLMLSYDDSPIIDVEETDREQFAHSAILFYLDAITTEKGKEILKQILNDDK